MINHTFPIFQIWVFIRGTTSVVESTERLSKSSRDHKPKIVQFFHFKRSHRSHATQLGKSKFCECHQKLSGNSGKFEKSYFAIVLSSGF